MEAPECPICLESYDGSTVTPRVLACGHSACEECLSQLPRPFSLPAVVRCPACTQIVHFPDPLGASALPKNIDLLRISLLLLYDNPTSSEKSSISGTLPTNQQIAPKRRFFSPVWSDEIYSVWKDWIFPQGSILIQRGGEQVSVCFSFNSAPPLIRRVNKDQEIRLLRIGAFDSNGSASELEYSYVAKVMCVLSKMNELQRKELDSILMLSLMSQPRICNIYGLWLDDESGSLYLVCERKNGSLLKFDDTNITVEKEDKVHTLMDDRVSRLANICIELCEILVGLQSKGFVCGCLGLSCLRLDEFGRVYLDLCEIIVKGRNLRMCISTAVKCSGKIGDLQVEELIESISKIDVLVSPELLFDLLRNEGVHVGSSNFKCSPASLDVWVLSCVFIRLLAGKQFTDNIFKYLSGIFQMRDGEPSYECMTLFMNWAERADNMLEASIGSNFTSVTQTLVKCLKFNPQSRPYMIDVWRVIKELTIKPYLDEIVNLREPVRNKSSDHCFVLGQLCSASDDCKHEQRMDQLHDRCSEDGVCSTQALAMMQDKDSAKSLSVHKVISMDLQQHRDCVTGLTIGVVPQDFAHVHTLRGPEHRIMAVTFVIEEQPICISGDIGGGIFIWRGNPPFGQEPLKKWYEEKDWRYNGIYALAAPANGYLYTGGGDRLIKAWSLLDCSLLCTMEGHKSVVSSLAVCNSILYSGSWDGTVRLWNLHNHSPLAVLGEDTPGDVASIHSLYADNHTIVAAHENGFVKVWLEDDFKKHIQIHDGSVFAIAMEGKHLFTGGWDKAVKIQEMSRDGAQLDITQVGSILCDLVITSLLSENGKLFIGCSSGLIKVYHRDQLD